NQLVVVAAAAAGFEPRLAALRLLGGVDTVPHLPVGKRLLCEPDHPEASGQAPACRHRPRDLLCTRSHCCQPLLQCLRCFVASCNHRGDLEKTISPSASGFRLSSLFALGILLVCRIYAMMSTYALAFRPPGLSRGIER